MVGLSQKGLRRCKFFLQRGVIRNQAELFVYVSNLASMCYE